MDLCEVMVAELQEHIWPPDAWDIAQALIKRLEEAGFLDKGEENADL